MNGAGGLTPDIIFEFLSDTFGLPARWFSTPQAFIFYFLIPLISLIAVWTVFLIHGPFKIFKNDAVNFGIGVILALTTSSMIKWWGPAWIAGVGVGGSLMISGRMTFWRAVGGLALFFITAFLYRNLLGFLGLSTSF